MAAGVALSPPAKVTAGSPGTSASRKKTAKETMSSTGMMLTRRRRTNLPIRPPYYHRYLTVVLVQAWPDIALPHAATSK